MSAVVNRVVAPARRRLLVLGATGGTGRLIVQQALARGDQVRALVRSPGRARGLDGAEFVTGDARDGEVLRAALRGTDATG